MSRLAILLFTALALTMSGVTTIMAQAPAEQRVEWNWGELIYGRTYRGVITLQNPCTTEQTVLLGTEGAPELTIDRFVRLPPRTVVKVPYSSVLVSSRDGC